MDKPKRKHRTRKKRIDIEPVSKSSSSTATTSSIEPKEKEKAQTSTQDDNKSPRQTEAQDASGSPRGSGASSPEPNCAICLGRLENRSFTDSCFHTFCFVCLVEWSKVKAECPLCKQSFKSIYHNVRSNDDYDQYPVRRHEEPNHLNQLRGLMEGMRFRYRTTVTDHHYATGVAARIDHEIQSRLLQRPSNRLPIPNWRRIRQPANSDFRRSVYLQRLKQRSEHMNTRRRVRETSPTFFRDNPAQTHRLVPWLNRELTALLHGHGEQIAFVLDLIMGLIKRHAINSEEFYQHVYPFVGRHTRQFMEEFMTFAKSPYHMAAYDRHVTYEAGQERHHDSESDSDQIAPDVTDDGNDSDVVVVSPESSPETRINPAAAPPRSDSNLDPWERSIMTVGNPSYLGFPPIMRSFGSENLSSLGLPSFVTSCPRVNLPTSASGWDSPTPGPSSIFDNMGLIPTQSFLPDHSMLPGTSASIWNPSSSSFSAPITPTQTHTESADNLLDPLNLQQVSSNSQRDPIVCTESESDSNSDEVMIVDYEKPWEDRSPIQLSSACEDTDSDIVITGMSYAENSIKKEKKKKKKHKKKDSKEKDKDISRKRPAEDNSDNKLNKKRRHSEKSSSRSIQSSSRHDRSRSKSKSPVPLSTRFGSIDEPPGPLRISVGSKSKTKSPVHTRFRSRSKSKSPVPIRMKVTTRSKSPVHTRFRSRSKSKSPEHIRIGQPSIGSSMSYSPIRMRLYKPPPDYSHKKFGYRTEFRDSRRDRHHSRRSHSSTSSRHSHRHRSSSGSLTDSDPGSDTRHVSYTSHKHRNASIEILEYTKKSSKHKKNKKHKKDKKKGEKKSDHKESKEKDKTETRELKIHVIDPKKKHSKSKKKKSKHKTNKERTQRESERKRNKDHDSSSEQLNNADSDERNFPQGVSRHVARLFKEMAEIKQQTGKETQNFTSDSDADSDVDTERVNSQNKEHDSENDSVTENSKDKSDILSDVQNQKSVENSNTAKDGVDISISNAQLNSEVFAASEIEFVELPLDQTASVDLELASIAKSLDNSTSSIVDSISEHKRFKKHPFGHKKSGKHTVESLPVTDNNSVGQQVSVMPVSAMHQSNLNHQRKQELKEDHIQFSDISSCTDIGNVQNTEKVNKNKHKNSTTLNIPDNSRESNGRERVSENRPSCKSESSYESPTSSAYVGAAKDTCHGPDYLDVETLSGDSDVDVVGESYTQQAIPSYQTSSSSIKIANSNNSRVEHNKGLSACSQPVHYDTDSPRPEIDMYKDEIDVTGVSDSESAVQFVGEEHRKITIGSDTSDYSDDNSYIEVLNNDSDHYVDVLGHSDVDTLDSESDYIDVTDNQSGENVNIHSDSDATELDYSDDVDHGTNYNKNPNEVEMIFSSPERDQQTVFSNSIICINSSHNIRILPLSAENLDFSTSESCVSKTNKIGKELEIDSEKQDENEKKVESVSDNSCNDEEFCSSENKTDTENAGSLNEDCDSVKNCPKASNHNRTECENEETNQDLVSNKEELAQTSKTYESDDKNIEDSTLIKSSSQTDTAEEPVTSKSSATIGSSDLSWTNNPVFEPREPDFLSDTGNMYPGMEPHSPLFQPSPEYEQLGFNEFSPVASDTSDEHFVPED